MRTLLQQLGGFEPLWTKQGYVDAGRWRVNGRITEVAKRPLRDPELAAVLHAASEKHQLGSGLEAGSNLDAIAYRRPISEDGGGKTLPSGDRAVIVLEARRLNHPREAARVNPVQLVGVGDLALRIGDAKLIAVSRGLQFSPSPVSMTRSTPDLSS